jgi:SAM-dependent methyltransferase
MPPSPAAQPITNPAATCAAVQAVYSGPERALWELLMGEQIHIGGFGSSQDLAARAGVKPGLSAVDLCACTGAGLRFLARFHGLAHGIGVDMTQAVLDLGEGRNRRDGVSERIRLVQAEATATSLPAGQADLVWGEDAWCYVADKPALVREALRLDKPGGTIAFTDWRWGPSAAAPADAARFLAFMKFPGMFALGDYRAALTAAGLTVETAHDTGRFAGAIGRYLADIADRYTYDALSIIGFDQELAGAIVSEMQHAQALARSGALIQGLVVARKG